MALPLNIDDLIHQRKVESARIEYKRDWNPEKVLHSVCAFANDIDNWCGGYIILGEGRNTGIGKIVRAMRENGSPPPEFYNPETRSFMTVILPIHTAFKAEAEERISPHSAKAMEKSLEETREKTREKTGEKILRYLAENPAATQNDIVAVIGISVKGVEWNLKTLKESGRLRRVGPDKGGHWEVVW